MSRFVRTATPVWASWPRLTRRSGSLYIYTFLITIIVLASISGALLFRAYYIRRRFQRRIEEAIQNGQPLPQDAAAALGLLRPRQKKEKKLPPMPGMWEAEMVLGEKADEEASVGMGGEGASWEKADSSRWEGITVSLRPLRCTVANTISWASAQRPVTHPRPPP